MPHAVVSAVVRAGEKIVGRPRAAKLARFVTNQIRLDVGNKIATNGELIVQKFALQAPSPVVMDVGAHHGEWSLNLLDQPGHRPVLHLFEPSAPSAEQARIALGSQAVVHQLAMSDRSGSGIMHIVHEGAGSNSVVAFTDERRTSGETEPVVFTTVTEFCAAKALSNVRLLKVDAEGHDLSILRGAQGMLANRSIDLVQFEYNLRWIDSRTFLLDAFELLQAHGYSMGKVTACGVEAYPRWHPELEKFVEGNYLAYLPSRAAELPTIPWWGP